MKNYSHNIALYGFVCMAIMLLHGCHGLRTVPEGKYLLNKNVIKADNKALEENLLPIVKQKPNRKVLGSFRFHLNVYSWAAKHPQRKFNKYLMKTVGEPPVLLDTMLMHKSAEQLRLYMHQHGYYNVQVTDTASYSKKKATVYYVVKSNTPYTINSYTLQADDRTLQARIKEIQHESLIHVGDKLDETACIKERDRILKALKNMGYFNLTTDYIQYGADTMVGNNLANVKLLVRNNVIVVDSNVSREAMHQQYTVKKVFVYAGFDPLLNDTITQFTDTLYHEGLHFLYKPGSRMFLPRVLSKHILIKSESLYNSSDVENSYVRLADIGVFKFINIKFGDFMEVDSTMQTMNCYILLTPTRPKSYNIESELTHNGGNLGVAGNLVFRNNNALKNAELLEIKFLGSLEATRTVLQSETDKDKTLFLFNTFQYGPEVNLSFREFVFPFASKLARTNQNIVTTVTSKYNKEARPEFNRATANISIGYNFRNFRQGNFIWTPVSVNLLDVALSDAFRDKLLAIGDKGLISSYQQQLSTAGALSYVFEKGKRKARSQAAYLRVNIETSGHTLYLYDEITGNTKNNDGRYTRFDIPYTTYTRPDFDFRLYKFFEGSNSIVFRMASGIGYTYLNSTKMPFEKNFFAGGSNDQRAWLSRTLGPGSFNKGDNFNRIGDLKINSNVEYRFEILRILEGALFIDAGNIWNLKKDKDFPGGEITSKRFTDEIAVGTGVGVRVNFTFFIFRLDAAAPIKDPSKIDTGTWVYSKLQPRDVRLNFGIGYPF